MKHTLTLAAAAVMVATSAAAEQRSGFYIGGDLGQSNWGLGQTEAQDFSDIISEGIDFYAPFALVTPDKANVEDTDFTYSLFIGYQFVPWLAIEGTWMDLGKSTIKTGGTYDYEVVVNPPIIDGGTYSANADLESSGWALSVLPMLPIGESWDLFARLGYFWGDNDLTGHFTAQDDLNGTPVGSPYDVPNFHGSDDNDVFLWGAGFQWTWDQTVSVRLEYSQLVDLLDTGSSTSSVDRYTLGLVYRFGHKEEAAPVAAAPVAAAPVAAAAPAACPDSDKDGVCNANDKCPNTPAGDRVGQYGCSCDVTIRTHFAFDSAELTAEDKAALDKAAVRLNELQFVDGVANGYTDDVGEEAYNQKLSERRAQAVVDYLAAQGVAAGRIKAVGYGEADPIADNATEDGRAQNRRVTIRRTDCGPAN